VCIYPSSFLKIPVSKLVIVEPKHKIVKGRNFFLLKEYLSYATFLKLTTEIFLEEGTTGAQ
jgi:hypothetical protein